MASFVENVNKLSLNLDTIVNANSVFDDSVLPILKEVADLDLQEVTEDFKKGNYLGNRKIDIDLSLNKLTSESIVSYSKADIILVSGEIISIPFLSGNSVLELTSHNDIRNYIVNHPLWASVRYTECTVEEATSTSNTLIRFRDSDGNSSSIERVELTVYSGTAQNIKPVYFWAQTTSALQTIANRVGDIIALGNNIGNIIELSQRVDELNELQAELTNLLEIHANLAEILLADTNAGIATTKAAEALASQTSILQALSDATAQATIATNQAIIATNKANEIKGITTQTTTGAAGSLAQVSYNSTDGKLSFVIPQGLKGDRGEAFKVNALGLYATRTTYDTQPKDFSFFATDTSMIYFKNSDASADWSAGIPFGKGDTGPTGATGDGIDTIDFVGSSDASNLPNVAGATDVYRITMTSGNTFDFSVYNGANPDISMEDLTLHVNNKNNPHAVTKAQLGLGNVDNTADKNKPISTAQQEALDAKANKATTLDGYGIEDAYTKEETEALVAQSGGGTAIEQTTTPILGLIWNQTDDSYKRVGKNINYLTIDGFNEFSAWRSPTAERQNDNDTVSSSPLSKWLDETANLPYSSIKRYVIDNIGAEVKTYNADSYTHADQTSITATQQIMVKMPKFHFIQAKVTDGGKTYHVYMLAKEEFSVDFVVDLGFVSPTISLWNVTGMVSSGTAEGSVVTSALHPAFIDNTDTVLPSRYYGAFNAVSGRSICGSAVKATGNITRATARTQAQGFGSGFTLIDFFLESAKNILALVEHGTWYFDVGKWRGYDWNTSASANNQDNGLTLPLLDKTGVILDASNRVIANSYRGIENYHSALWRFVDGVNSNNYSIYLAKPKATFTDDIIVAPYFDSGVDVVAGASASYVADHASGTFIPSTLGGSASTKTCDGAWSASGNTILVVGGSLAYGATSGLSACASNNVSSLATWDVVGRPGL